jgi:hypothetical protein
VECTISTLVFRYRKDTKYSLTEENHACFVPLPLKVGLKFSSCNLKLSFRLNLSVSLPGVSKKSSAFVTPDILKCTCSKLPWYHGHYTRTYLHIKWNRVHLEKLTSLQLVKKIPTFYGTRRFSTAFTSARQL